MTITRLAVMSVFFVVACGSELSEVPQMPMEEGPVPTFTTGPNTEAANDIFGSFLAKDPIRNLQSQISSGARPLIPASGLHFCVRGTDYATFASPWNPNTNVTILSIHGGLIELNTSVITLRAAQLFNWDRYDFTAQGTPACLRGSTNRAILHITATHFNDPDALNLVTAHPKAVAIHGNRYLVGGRSNMICIGGRDEAARRAFRDMMATIRQQFALNLVDAPTTAVFPCDEAKGTDPSNIVNLTTTKQGLQLEMGEALIARLAASNNQDTILATTFYAALQEAMNR